MFKTKKLIVITDNSGMRIFESVGLKVTKEMGNITTDILLPHKKRLKREGRFGRLSTQTHFFDPHTQLKQKERHEKVSLMANYLRNFLRENPIYQEVIVIAEPKVLGEFRRNEANGIWSLVTKEVPKDLMRADIPAIEKLVFG